MKLFSRAFTLIELLIVVAIIAILAAIAMPNFLEAQVRSKISRTKTDMRTLAGAMESYAVDNNCYPPLPIGLGPRFHRFRPLTTPISYMTTVPKDPFDSVDAKGPGPGGPGGRGMYAYGCSPIDTPVRWVLASDGPDQQPDVPMEDLIGYQGYTLQLFGGDNPPFKLYDATNGTISRGDIVRASDYIPN